MEIKKLREKKNLTQGELANLMGVNIRQIQRWEVGNPPMPQKYFTKMEKVLSSSVEKVVKMSDSTDLIGALMDHKVTGNPIQHDTIDQIADELNSIPKLKAERAALYKALERE